MDPYLTVKWIHILSSTVLFGTGIGTAFQMVWVWQTGQASHVHQVARGVAMADWIFTTPAGVVQPLSGLALVYLQGWSLTEPWLVATYILYTIALACWLPVVWLQLRIRDLTAQTAPDDPPSPKVRHYFRIWFTLGWPAFLALVTVFWLMVSKPEFAF